MHGFFSKMFVLFRFWLLIRATVLLSDEASVCKNNMYLHFLVDVNSEVSRPYKHFRLMGSLLVEVFKITPRVSPFQKWCQEVSFAFEEVAPLLRIKTSTNIFTFVISMLVPQPKPLWNTETVWNKRRISLSITQCEVKVLTLFAVMFWERQLEFA